MATHNVGLTNSQIDDYLRAKYPMRINDSLNASTFPFVTSSGLPKRITFEDLYEIFSGGVAFRLEKGVSPAYQQTVPAWAKSVVVNSVGGAGNTGAPTSITSVKSLNLNNVTIGEIPFVTSTISELVYYGGLRKISDATFDEYDLVHKRLIRRVGRQNANTLTFSIYSLQDHTFSAEVQGKAPGWYNVICDGYTRPLTYNGTLPYRGITGIAGETYSTMINIRDTRYSTVNEFAAAMESKVIYFGLRDPYSVDISQALPSNNILPVEAGGSIVFEQADSAMEPIQNEIIFSSLPAPD